MTNLSTIYSRCKRVKNLWLHILSSRQVPNYNLPYLIQIHNSARSYIIKIKIINIVPQGGQSENWPKILKMAEKRKSIISKEREGIDGGLTTCLLASNLARSSEAWKQGMECEIDSEKSKANYKGSEMKNRSSSAVHPGKRCGDGRPSWERP